MSSNANKMNDATSLHPTEPALCANGCGFFGSASTMNLCSKCFRDSQINNKQAASAKAVKNKLVNKVGSSFSSAPVAAREAVVAVEEVMVRVSNRCLSCNKKVGVMGFKCKCGEVFCGAHRYPEEHGCEFDFKRTGREAIAKANPVVKADKVNRI